LIEIMGTITAKSIIDKASTQLLDPSNVRWTRAELLGWLNDGQRQITVMSPNATNKVATIKLAVGTRQSIPSDGWTLLDVIRTMGTDGTKPGRAMRLVSQELIDGFNPYWHSDTPTATPKNYIFDQQDQTVFYVYPPNNGKGYVQLNYSPVPTDLGSELLTITINDIFQTALLDYILYRACSKDSEYAPGLQLASGYLQTFMGSMQAKSVSELANSPNQQMQPFNTSVPGTTP
jgi:hypothetical protein